MNLRLVRRYKQFGCFFASSQKLVCYTSDVGRERVGQVHVLFCWPICFHGYRRGTYISCRDARGLISISGDCREEGKNETKMWKEENAGIDDHPNFDHSRGSEIVHSFIHLCLKT